MWQFFEWTFTQTMRMLDHWQALDAGLLGFAAAILVVVLTLQSESRKAQRELDALRQSLGVEIRQSLAVALGTFLSLSMLAQKDDGPITLRMLESYAYLQTPIIFPAVADKIGLLGTDAMQVLVFYSAIDVVRRKVANLATYRTPDDISATIIAMMTTGLGAALQQGTSIISKFKTNDPATDARDDELMSSIANAISAWTEWRDAKWPPAVQQPNGQPSAPHAS